MSTYLILLMISLWSIINLLFGQLNRVFYDVSNNREDIDAADVLRIDENRGRKPVIKKVDCRC